MHADDGLDEISIGSETYVAELKDGEVTTYTVQPEDFGMQRTELSALKAEDADDSLRIIKSVLANKDGPAKDIVCLNAGAAIYAAGLAGSFAEGVGRAQEVIASGESAAKLEQLVTATNA